jgi:hypothetical protein
MPDWFPSLARRLVALEETLPYVTLDDLAAHWHPRTTPKPPGAQRARSNRADPPATPDLESLVREAIDDQRLFTDLRTRLDPATGATAPVHLIRLNRRHPAVAAALDESEGG